ncbi:hypothetical protein FHETE_5409 [Fusarium heterosporum]|uniref:Uncharacterized protein n=1 Tax=Fusarium heterosporum TaxID=42747 RepID=A0A8H5TEK1_FUSHE|nr:hypothetical protein FHETE_5409 [Fusarium heterosporum]
MDNGSVPYKLSLWARHYSNEPTEHPPNAHPSNSSPTQPPVAGPSGLRDPSEAQSRRQSYLMQIFLKNYIEKTGMNQLGRRYADDPTPSSVTKAKRYYEDEGDDIPSLVKRSKLFGQEDEEDPLMNVFFTTGYTTSPLSTMVPDETDPNDSTADESVPDEPVLINIDWSASDIMEDLPLTEEQKELTKIPMYAFSKAEQAVARVLFNKHLLDYGPETPEEACQAKEKEIPDDSLSWGVRWTILWVLSKMNRFAKTVSFVLHLTRRQVQEFMEMYIRQYYLWDSWQEDAEKIPYAQLLEHALEKRQTVAGLLHDYRPLLFTDQISHEDREKGVILLQELRIPGVVEEFEEFAGQGMLDFLRLDIEWDFIQEAIDKQQIMAAAQLGWLDSENTLKTVLGKPQTKSVPSIIPVPGTSSNRPKDEEHDYPEADVGAETTNDKEASPQDNGKQPARPEPQNKVEDCLLGSAPLFSLIPGPLGKQALPMQRDMLRMASQRIFPEVHRQVRGFAVSTLVEQGRGPLPAPSAYCPRGYHLYAQQILQGIVGRDNQDPEEGILGTPSANKHTSKERPVGNMGESLNQRQVRNTMVENISRIAPRSLGSQESPISYFRDATVHNTYSFNASRQNPGSSDNHAAVQAPQSTHDQGFQDSIFKSAPLDLEPNLFANSGRPTFPPPQYPTSTRSEEPPVEATHLDQLRQMLDSKYAKIIQDKKKKKPNKKAPNARDRASLEIEDDDETEEEDAMTLPIVLPEPEKDEEYNPKKKRAPKKQRASRAAGRKVGRPRKHATDKNESEQPVVQAGNGQPHQKSQEFVESAEIKPTDINSTPNKRALGDIQDDPPSSGRIKVLVRSSQDSTSTSPDHKQTPTFETPQGQQSASTHTHAMQVRVAASANYATYAKISDRARFAHIAGRIAQPPGKAVEPNVPSELERLHKLATAFQGLDMSDAQDAGRAEFAMRAERADYAGRAEEANFAMRIEDLENRDGHS